MFWNIIKLVLAAHFSCREDDEWCKKYIQM